MASYIVRRKLLAMLGGTAASWPLAARAQQPAMPVVGFISSRSPSESGSAVFAFRQGLAEIGYVDGQNVGIAFRWAEGRYDRLPTLAADLTRHPVAVIFATGANPVAFAAKAATATIPIAFITGSDPVEVGLVASLNHSGSNVTDVSSKTSFGIDCRLIGYGSSGSSPRRWLTIVALRRTPNTTQPKRCMNRTRPAENCARSIAHRRALKKRSMKP